MCNFGVGLLKSTVYRVSSSWEAGASQLIGVGHPPEGVRFTCVVGVAYPARRSPRRAGHGRRDGVDTARDRGAWRHPVRFVRLREDMLPGARRPLVKAWVFQPRANTGRRAWARQWCSSASEFRTLHHLGKIPTHRMPVGVVAKLHHPSTLNWSRWTPQRTGKRRGRRRAAPSTRHPLDTCGTPQARARRRPIGEPSVRQTGCARRARPQD